MKKKMLALSFSLLLLLSPFFATNAFASTNINQSRETELLYLTYVSEQTPVPYVLSITMNMDIAVYYPGKIITGEYLYTTIPGGAMLPFTASLNVGTIKYYKDNVYRTSHALHWAPYVFNDSDLHDYGENNPNSDLSATSVYKAAGNVNYYSSSTWPVSYTADVKDYEVE